MYLNPLCAAVWPFDPSLYGHDMSRKSFFSADKSALTMSFYDIVDVTNVVIWLTVKWRSNNHLVPTGYLCENKGCLPDRIFFFS
jgi:hypothetical protein